MHFPNVNITVEALFLLHSQEKCGAFFSYNLHKKIRVPHLWRKITWSIWDPSVFKMAAKSEFSKNHKKIRFVDISEISPERYITGHKETIESLKNRVNFPDSCPLIMNTFLPALLWASCSISRLTEFSLSLHPLFWCHMVSLSYISDLTKPRRRRQRERQNTIILMSKTTTLHVHHAFLYISMPSLRNYDVKWPDFKFTWEWKRQGDKFYHLCPNLSAFPSLHLQPLSDREVPIKELWQRRRQRGH